MDLPPKKDKEDSPIKSLPQSQPKEKAKQDQPEEKKIEEIPEQPDKEEPVELNEDALITKSEEQLDIMQKQLEKKQHRVEALKEFAQKIVSAYKDMKNLPMQLHIKTGEDDFALKPYDESKDFKKIMQELENYRHKPISEHSEPEDDFEVWLKEVLKSVHNLEPEKKPEPENLAGEQKEFGEQLLMKSAEDINNFLDKEVEKINSTPENIPRVITALVYRQIWKKDLENYEKYDELVKKLTEQNGKLQANFDRIQKEMEEKKVEAFNLEKELNDTKKELDTTKVHTTQLMNEALIKTEELKKTADQVKEKGRKIFEMQQELDGKNADLEEAKNKVETLSKGRQEDSNTINDLTQKLNSLLTDFQKVSSEKSQLDKEHASLMAELDSAKLRVEDQSLTIKFLDDAIARSTANETQLRKTENELRKTIDKQSREIKALNVALKEGNLSFESKVNQFQEMDTKMKNLEKFREETDKMVEAIREERKILEENILNLINEKKVLEEKKFQFEVDKNVQSKNLEIEKRRIEDMGLKAGKTEMRYAYGFATIAFVISMFFMYGWFKVFPDILNY